LKAPHPTRPTFSRPPYGEIDRLLGRNVFAVNLQAVPDPIMRACFMQMQDMVQASVPSGLFRCPSAALHLTIFPIISVRGQCEEDARRLWADIAAATLPRLNQIALSTAPIVLREGRLSAKPAAIIFEFVKSVELDTFRHKIHQAIRHSNDNIQYPTIAHVTLFRFERKIPLAPIARVVDNIIPNLHPWEIDELVLRQEDVYPSLKTSVISTFRLTTSTQADAT
jgi:hypothetical protein